ncbi:unnamed protein product [Microthlaspi erraticum]|uniref:Uncharacterized protein n=1 Tax=Microthlaspi erraticum TaxID=1685480 RepID=A0A6D2J8A1_9BRAS|nr:unnamed protein product [Microthlaspi erraticum]
MEEDYDEIQDYPSWDEKYNSDTDTKDIIDMYTQQEKNEEPEKERLEKARVEKNKMFQKMLLEEKNSPVTEKTRLDFLVERIASFRQKDFNGSGNEEKYEVAH